MTKSIIFIENAQDIESSTLKLKAFRVDFPLSQEDKNLINDMKKILLELEAVGLAATQVNVRKNISVIHISKDAALLRNNAAPYPMHVIINAEYEPVESEGIYEDFEGCHSVKSIYGKVKRYNTIKVKYQNEEGLKVSKLETGFYARVLQHEIDHLNGLLITDRLTPNCLQGPINKMIKYRRDSLTEEKKILFDKLLAKKNIVIDDK